MEQRPPGVLGLRLAASSRPHGSFHLPPPRSSGHSSTPTLKPADGGRTRRATHTTRKGKVIINRSHISTNLIKVQNIKVKHGFKRVLNYSEIQPLIIFHHLTFSLSPDRKRLLRTSIMQTNNDSVVKSLSRV